ncbi:MAG: Glu-tRNA(Gln) amidotransferase subunit GatE [Candidatus Aminicenantes bacterium]|nr:Glu-tRNA(Gln) amidotransferase subunit GatE [Candidatus Aminicenantes bacterium]
MSDNNDPYNNWEKTKKAVGYVTREKAVQADYDRVGFRAGLEVHQQLKTKKKLFCNCPAGLYNQHDDFDAEIIRHMRPTLSELGEYDGTALMEFKTRKTIIYRIKNETACTYDIDDTPPFPMNREALEIALEISLLCRLNIVGEVHITRKQYLDGSIPTGFQRTAILGVEGEIPLRNKTIRLIQLSIEEDSCREVSDIGHVRTYQTDRLGMPLIETVTYPDFVNPEEVREGAEYIRFLNRSTGKVFTGIGSGREDVNVSCRGGTRVEIKGVAHNKWIPELTHNEVFRQWSLLRIRDLLQKKGIHAGKWKISHQELGRGFGFTHEPLVRARSEGDKVMAVNLPGFKGILSHFTQPGKMFADEVSGRLKVIACIEKPNMTHTETWEPEVSRDHWERIGRFLKAEEDDAQIILWGKEEDIPTALETVEERCKWAFEGVPNESRKSFEDGTTVFERVLPGPDRMYPDTDSEPIPLDDDYIEKLRKNLPIDVCERYTQLRDWHVPEDTYVYLLKNNLVPLIERINKELGIDTRFAGTLLGHHLKHIEGQEKSLEEFRYEKIFELLAYLKNNHIEPDLAKKMLPVIVSHPRMDMASVLTTIKFKKVSRDDIINRIPFLLKKFEEIGISSDPEARAGWIMGELRRFALGNMPLAELRQTVEDYSRKRKKETSPSSRQ